MSSPSNPDLGQADLSSLLLTGRPFDDLAPGDAAFVGTQVLGNFSGEVLGFAGRAIGLDTIRLGGPETRRCAQDPIAVATELDPTTRLTFGKSLGPDVDVTFSQSLRDGDAQTWIVDYLPPGAASSCASCPTTRICGRTGSGTTWRSAGRRGRFRAARRRVRRRSARGVGETCPAILALPEERRSRRPSTGVRAIGSTSSTGRPIAIGWKRCTRRRDT